MFDCLGNVITHIISIQLCSHAFVFKYHFRKKCSFYDNRKWGCWASPGVNSSVNIPSISMANLEGQRAAA